MIDLLNLSFCLPLTCLAASDADIRMGQPLDAPSIGLQIVLPAAMTPLPLDNLTDWARVGIRGEGESYNQILVLSALPEGSFRDARTAAEVWTRQAERQRTAYAVSAQRKVEWQSNGWEVLAGYRLDGKSVTSLQWYGWREGRPAIVYVLTYDAVGGEPEVMRKIVRVVAGSCRNTPIRPASTQPVRLGNRQILPNDGVSLQVPDSLRVMEPNRKGMLLRAGAVDYLRDRLLPVLTLTANAAQPGESPKARLDRSINALMPSLRPADGKIASSQPAKLGDRPAQEVTFSVIQRRERLMTALRLTLWRDRALVLSLTYPAANAKELAEAMEKVAESFKFQP
jgi:hypothetical protein